MRSRAACTAGGLGKQLGINCAARREANVRTCRKLVELTGLSVDTVGPIVLEHRLMLIISRRVGESFHLGESVTVTVLEVHGNHVRVGVAAPREIVIDRAEVRLRKQREASHEEALAASSGGTLRL